jgi:hypothetical protein
MLFNEENFDFRFDIVLGIYQYYLSTNVKNTYLLTLEGQFFTVHRNNCNKIKLFHDKIFSTHRQDYIVLVEGSFKRVLVPTVKINGHKLSMVKAQSFCLPPF